MPQTSSFEIAGRHPAAVSIAQRSPAWFRGRRVLGLAPEWSTLSDYRRTGDVKTFTARFQAQLDRLDPHAVLRHLGDTGILCCWEAPGRFCHRRLVAAWLEQTTGITVPEFEDPLARM